MSNLRLTNRKSNRLRDYDYSQAGYYFVTVCTENRENCLGKISNGQMVLNGYGAVAAHYWQEIPKHYSNVELDKWVIMPNHIHGIIMILPVSVGTAQCAVPTKFVSLSQIIKSFKEATVKRIRFEFKDANFQWQRSFYDQVIRGEAALEQMREYILNNPKKWELDDENPVCHSRHLRRIRKVI